MKPFPYRMTNGDKYGPAMALTDVFAAKEYFEACVAHTMSHGHSREEAERIERTNLAYWAGYHSDDVRRRVEALFDCQHPVFGKIAVNRAPSPEVALAMGIELAKKSKLTPPALKPQSAPPPR